MFQALDVALDVVFRGRIEGDDVNDAGGVFVLCADGAGQAVAGILGQDFRILGLAGPVAKCFENRLEVADWDAFAQQAL